jgi:hypothetical protein
LFWEFRELYSDYIDDLRVFIAKQKKVSLLSSIIDK